MAVRSGGTRALRLAHSIAFRRALIQAASATLLFALAWLLFRNLASNLSADGIQIDFGFLRQESGFDVNESLIAYSASDSYAAALFVGFANTLHLTAVCILISTVIGLFVGFARCSRHWLVSTAARLYVESMRNLPKLLILLAAYVLLVRELPGVRDAWSFFGLAYLSNRGLHVPALVVDGGPFDVLFALVVSLCGSAALLLMLRKFMPGPQPMGFFTSLVCLSIPCTFVFLMFTGNGATIDMPEFAGFNFSGGAAISIPFLSLTIALSIYHGGQIGEVVRGGIQSVPKGQAEAGHALGLRSFQIAWLIVLPQALRAMIPPMANQYLNLMKNTSIALAVGYSDLVSIMNTSINQTFRPVELMLLTMSVYLAIGLTVSTLLNLFNRLVQLKEN